jgi:hypothetical protein
MADSDQPNSAKGRDSFDVATGNTLVHFFNRNITPYATEAGGVKFDLVPVESQKDLMVNAARMHAQQEYDRIMELVTVLQRQAADIKRRLDITDMVRAAKYNFQTYHGQTYWLVQDTRFNCTRLVHLGPTDWATGIPQGYEYITQVKWLGDYTWQEVILSTD